MLDQKSDQKTVERSPDLVSKKRSPLPIVLIALLALTAIGLGVWALYERGEADGLSADLVVADSEIVGLKTDLAGADSQVVGLSAELAGVDSQIAELEAEMATVADVVVVGGGPLTGRQEDMLALVTGPWLQAWRAGDGEAVAAFYAPDAVLYDIAGGDELRTTDGTLQSFVARWPTIELQPGLIVHGNRIFSVLRHGARDVGGITEFTRSGELLIASAALYDSALRYP